MQPELLDQLQQVAVGQPHFLIVKDAGAGVGCLPGFLRLGLPAIFQAIAQIAGQPDQLLFAVEIRRTRESLEFAQFGFIQRGKS